MESIISSYGFDFINLNDYYIEMELDFSKDFYNGNHVNCFGAEKYTDFLGKYIVNNYNMPDHRNEDRYISWHDDFAKFKEEESEIKEKICQKKLQAEEGHIIASTLSKTINFMEWAALVNDSRFTILAVGNGEMVFQMSATDKKAFNIIGLDIPEEGRLYAKVVSGGNEIFSNADGIENGYEGIVGVEDVVNSYCKIETSSNKLSIIIDEKEYSRQDEGINIVVFENDYHYVVDVLTLKNDEYGNIQLIR